MGDRDRAPEFIGGADVRPFGDALPGLSVLARAATVANSTGESLLQELCQVASRALRVDGAGVTVADAEGPRILHAQPQALFDVERHQDMLRQGPRASSIARLTTVVFDEAASRGPWPGLADRYARAGVRSVLAVPLLARGHAWGALSLYRTTSEGWTERDVAVATLLADVAASYVVLARDRDDAGALQRDLEHRATHDGLTGLPNRELLLDRLEHALLAARRQHTRVAVMYVDVDDFKALNDTWGHVFGDAVLVEVARRLGRALRDGDTLGRMSGDEFLIVCEGLSGSCAQITHRMRTLGRRLGRQLEESPDDDPLRIQVSVSIGAAVRGELDTAEQLIGAADRAMYAAKRAGGGRLVVGGPDVVALFDYRSGGGARPDRGDPSRRWT
jgi:diguanylate cyclase (GGDEF)-like protein